MNKLIQFGKDFIQDEEGLTIVEYVIGAALLVIAFVTFFNGMAGKLTSKLNSSIESIGTTTSG